METEKWKDIESFEGYYQISQHGRVRGLNRVISNGNTRREKVLKSIITNIGYCTVHLSMEGVCHTCKIHRLVAQAFIPNPDNKPEVNHKDGNKQNNHVSNLEWCTCSENVQHAFDIGLKDSPKYWLGKKGADHRSSKCVIKYSLDGEKISEYGSISEAERETGIRHQSISKCCNGQLKKTGGFKWKFK